MKIIIEPDYPLDEEIARQLTILVNHMLQNPSENEYEQAIEKTRSEYNKLYI
jgi:hypothetical protein